MLLYDAFSYMFFFCAGFAIIFQIELVDVFLGFFGSCPQVCFRQIDFAQHHSINLAIHLEFPPLQRSSDLMLFDFAISGLN